VSGSEPRKRTVMLAGLLRFLADTGASSLAEFAVSLPLLVVLVVGIFDFGGAFNQKQQLSNAMREAARFGASEATNDLATGTAPPSVDAIRYLVDSYLVTAGMQDCGLGTLAPATSGPPWIYVTTGSCVGTLTLNIARDPPSGATLTQATCVLVAQNYGSPNPVAQLYIPCTQVTISYPYQWHFNSVIQLLVPGAVLGLSEITAGATAANMN
jgi:Flp pilus assembly protein TadG